MVNNLLANFEPLNWFYFAIGLAMGIGGAVTLTWPVAIAGLYFLQAPFAGVYFQEKADYWAMWFVAMDVIAMLIFATRGEPWLTAVALTCFIGAVTTAGAHWFEVQSLRTWYYQINGGLNAAFLCCLIGHYTVGQY